MTGRPVSGWYEIGMIFDDIPESFRRRKPVTILVAPPGTRIGEPGWRSPYPGETFSWDINGEMPHMAVQRDGVLLATGIPAAISAEPDGEQEEPAGQ